MSYDSEFAEFLGVMAGDGNLSIYKSDHKISISGHREDDFEYFLYLRDLFKRLFHKEIKLRDKKRYLSLELSNKNILNQLNKAGILVGKKSDKIEIPKDIMKNQNLSKYFLRGLADTDFSVTFKKGGRKKNSYPRICVDLGSKKIISQISSLLNSLKIKHTVYGRRGIRNGTKYQTYSIDINGKENLYKWLSEIGFHNPKHLTKNKSLGKIRILSS